MNILEETELEAAIERLTDKVEESIIASRVTNTLLLAQKMNVDPTEALQAQKVLRALSNVERHVRSDTNE